MGSNPTIRPGASVAGGSEDYKHMTQYMGDVLARRAAGERASVISVAAEAAKKKKTGSASTAKVSVPHATTVLR